MNADIQASIAVLLSAGLTFLLSGCSGEQEPSRATTTAPASTESGTRRMAARLDEITGGLDPVKNVFLNTQRAARMRAEMEQTPSARADLLPLLADELLRAGRTEEAIAISLSLLHPDPHDTLHAPPAVGIHRFLGLCYMRLGEQENCVAHHGVDSCLAPIRGTGVHTLTRGSRSAIAEFAAVLGDHPDDLGARWLLYIAYMTLGEYPDKVPPRWLIPPKTFTAEYDVGRFSAVARKAGPAIQGLGGGAIREAFDKAGFL